MLAPRHREPSGRLRAEAQRHQPAQPGLCDSRPGATELRILFQRPLEKLEALAQLWLRVLVGINKAFQVSIIGSCAPRWTRRRDREFELESIDDGARDLVLQRENSMHFALVRFRPNSKSVTRIDQLRGDTDSIAIAPNTTLEHVPDI